MYMWIKNLFVTPDYEKRRRGWDYAAGELLRGVSPMELDSRQVDYDLFDKGMDAAIDTAVKNYGWEDDRI